MPCVMRRLHRGVPRRHSGTSPVCYRGARRCLLLDAGALLYGLPIWRQNNSGVPRDMRMRRVPTDQSAVFNGAAVANVALSTASAFDAPTSASRTIAFDATQHSTVLAATTLSTAALATSSLAAASVAASVAATAVAAASVGAASVSAATLAASALAAATLAASALTTATVAADIPAAPTAFADITLTNAALAAVHAAPITAAALNIAALATTTLAPTLALATLAAGITIAVTCVCRPAATRLSRRRRLAA